MNTQTSCRKTRLHNLAADAQPSPVWEPRRRGHQLG